MPDIALRTEGLTKRFGDVVALDHLDLDVARGEVVGYLGPNGAGKTTTIRLLLGLSRPTEGRAEIFGLDCQRQPVETLCVPNTHPTRSCDESVLVNDAAEDSGAT
jgi:ABC-type multidrug transport system ATPase subunit